MAEVADRTVSAERTALAETRRRIGGTLDAIDSRVRPPAARVANGVAVVHQAGSALELFAAASAAVAGVRAMTRTVRSLSNVERVLVVGGGITALGVLAWVAHARETARR